MRILRVFLVPVTQCKGRNSPYIDHQRSILTFLFSADLFSCSVLRSTIVSFRQSMFVDVREQLLDRRFARVGYPAQSGELKSSLSLRGFRARCMGCSTFTVTHVRQANKR